MMKIITTYSGLQQFPAVLIPYAQVEYKKIQSCYRPKIPLEQHSIKEIGGFVLIEKESELADLSPLGFSGGLGEQCIEFAVSIPNTEPIFYDICVLLDTDGGYRLFICADDLSDKQKELIERIEKLDYN